MENANQVDTINKCITCNKPSDKRNKLISCSSPGCKIMVHPIKRCSGYTGPEIERLDCYKCKYCTTNDNKNKKRKTSITQFTPTTFDQNTSEFKKIKIPSEDITKDSLPNRDALNLTYDGTKINNKKRKSETESEDSTHSTLKDAGVEKEENNKKVDFFFLFFEE